MTSHVRESQPTPIAVPMPPVQNDLVNVIQIAKPVVEIKAPAAEETEDRGPSHLDKRRRRRARLSGRH